MDYAKKGSARPSDSRFPLLLALGGGLVLAGLCTLIVAATGSFLPHDEEFLGMSAKQLCALHGCRIVHFMIHDRVSFGGTIIAIGLLYIWLARSPLQEGAAWAWWVFALSGVVGFLSFFAYLGFGYLDAWHYRITVALFTCYVLGMLDARRRLGLHVGGVSLLRLSLPLDFASAAGWGRICLLSAGAGLAAAGLTICIIGMTSVFVPEDLNFLQVSLGEMEALNPRLIPLIAHDRAGFGGTLCCVGVTLSFCVWCGRPSVHFWRLLALIGVIMAATAIGIHPIIGYNDAFHLAPAVAGAIIYFIGIGLSFRGMCRPIGAAIITDGALVHSDGG